MKKQTFAFRGYSGSNGYRSFVLPQTYQSGPAKAGLDWSKRFMLCGKLTLPSGVLLYSVLPNLVDAADGQVGINNIKEVGCLGDG